MTRRFVAFVDDAESVAEVTAHFGRDNVLVISGRDLGPGVVRWRRETLERDVRRVADAHRERPFAGVVYWREPHVVVANDLARLLGLPPALGEPRRARDKLLMKDVLGSAVRCAESVLVRGPADLEAASSRLYPGVLKPRWGFASLCAVRVDDARSARRELAEKRDKLHTTHIERVDLGVPAAPEFVLESFVGGTEHTVESFVAGGEVVLQIVSDKLPMDPPHFVETGDQMPSSLSAEDQDRLRAVARAAIAALGIEHGWTHAELKLSQGEAWVIEIAARMGGGYTRELVNAAYGLDMLRAYFEYVTTGTRPALGPARGVVLGRRIILRGLSIVWSARHLERLRRDPRITVVPRESSARSRGVFLGVPYSYAGTLAAYLLRASSAEGLRRLDGEVAPAVEPVRVEVPLPRSWYRVYLRGRRILDDLPGS